MIKKNTKGIKNDKIIKKMTEFIGAIGGMGMEFNNIPNQIEIYKYDLNNPPKSFKNAKKSQ